MIAVAILTKKLLKRCGQSLNESELEKLVALKPGTCGFCLRVTELSKTLTRPGYWHFEARYVVAIESLSPVLELFVVEMYRSLKHLR